MKEECDSPGEYYYDEEEEAIYYTFNATEQPNGREEFSLTRAKVLFNITGTQASPVRDITISGLTIRDAAFTYLGTSWCVSSTTAGQALMAESLFTCSPAALIVGMAGLIARNYRGRSALVAFRGRLGIAAIWGHCHRRCGGCFD